MDRQNKNKIKVSVITLGCKVNQVESESINAEFQNAGYKSVGRGKDTDLCIINTCTVTGKAAMQSRQAIRKAIRENPNALIVATGCYAQADPLTLKKITGLDYIIANSDKHHIARIITSENQHLHKNLTEPIIIHKNIRNERCLHKINSSAMGARTRPFIKIQDGCDNFCTYCIVPYTRGPSRSLPPDEVMDEIYIQNQYGAKEIVLTGIHMGRYGLDLNPKTTLLKLLKRICESNMIPRVRLSSIEPNELTDELLHFASKSDRVCRHFHIPLQSGDNTILKKMKRTYDQQLFKKLIENISSLLPDAAIGVDIMIGFPGETDDAFYNTYDLINALPVSYLHVFPFSPRPGTPAFTFADQVDTNTIKNRRNKILKLGKDKKAAFYNKMIGKTLNVLVEEQRDAATGYLKGISSNYVRVMLNGENSLKNKLIKCRVKKNLTRDAVYGEVIDG